MELEHFDKYYKHGGTYEVPSSIFEDLIDDRNNYRDRCDIALNYIDQVLMYSISNFEYKKVYDELDKLTGILSKFGEDCKPDKDLLRIQLSGAETVVKEQEEEIERLTKIANDKSGVELNYFIEGLKGSIKEKNLEIERLNNIVNKIYTFLGQYTINHTWQKVVIEDTIKYIDELKGVMVNDGTSTIK